MKTYLTYADKDSNLVLDIDISQGRRLLQSIIGHFFYLNQSCYNIKSLDVPRETVAESLRVRSAFRLFFLYATTNRKEVVMNKSVLKKKRNTSVEIIKQNDQLWTTSLDIAEKFGKNHRDVVRKIENLDCSEQFKLRNFAQVSRTIRGGTHNYYIISRSGFSMLVMGFTGKKAAEWKEKYIDAFDRMEKIIMRLAHHVQKKGEIAYQQARSEGKIIRHEETDTIKELVEYATAQGSIHAIKYYTIISKMVNKHLFFLELAIKPDNIRELLSTMQLIQLSVADNLVAVALKEGMEKGMHYKDIYKMAKERVIAYSKVIGQTPILPVESTLPAPSQLTKGILK